MSVWDAYSDRISTHGSTKYDAAFKREVRLLDSKLKDNLSYQLVDVCPREYTTNIEKRQSLKHRFSQNVTIIDSDNLNEKLLYTMPSEDMELGAVILWMDNMWLVTERDANATIRVKVKLTQCNHLLKWLSSDGDIMEQWCVVEDGTKYLTGEAEDRNFVVTRGDSRIAIQLSRNSYTALLDRESRFLVDDPNTPHKLAYQLTKPLKVGNLYRSGGIYKFVLQEVTSTEYDNHELGIADYYRYYPTDYDSGQNSNSPDAGKKVWL